MKQQVVHFGNGSSDMKDKTRSEWPSTAVTSPNGEHPRKSASEVIL